MRLTIRLSLLTAAASLLSSCGGEKKQELPAENEEIPAPASTSASARPGAFGLCTACHSDEKGVNRLGPSLFGVMGRKAGTEAGFAYSPAMKAVGLSWDEASVDRFIENPHDVVPGTKMTFPGLKDPQKRAEVTHYLATLE